MQRVRSNFCTANKRSWNS